MPGYINQEQSCRCERLSLEGGVGETAVNDPSTMALLESATMGHFGAKVLHAASTLPPCLTQTADPPVKLGQGYSGKIGSGQRRQCSMCSISKQRQKSTWFNGWE